MMRLSLLLVVLLAGCASVPQKTQDPIPRVEQKPPAEALVPCVRPTGLEDDSFGAVVRKLAEVAGLLDDCARKHQQLTDYEKRKASGD